MVWEVEFSALSSHSLLPILVIARASFVSGFGTAVMGSGAHMNSQKKRRHEFVLVAVVAIFRQNEH
jgi:hypothetical protein